MAAIVAVSVLFLSVLAECDSIFSGTDAASLTAAKAGGCIPLVFPAAYILLSGSYTFYILHRTISSFRNMITRMSIRESADVMPVGLCFARPGGHPYLVNSKMDRLSHELLGHALTNESIFWNDISSGDLGSSAKHITVDDLSAILLRDGSVWAFERKIVKVGSREVVQLTASDITDLYKLAERLKNENSILQGMNLRLQQYSEDVEELVRTRERLAAKIRIHDAIGQDLMVSRYLLLSGDRDTIEEVFERWRKTIAMIRSESWESEDKGVMKYLYDAAGSAGVELAVEGHIPESADVRELIVAAGAEALTNAVRHAGASRLVIGIRATGDMYRVDFMNDCSMSGCRENGEICEGGGLSSLRCRIEAHGGMMSVAAGKEFTLSIMIPAERKTGI